MKTNRLLEKYSTKELAESFVFRTKLTTKQQKEADKELSEMRKKVQEKLTPNQIRLSRLLQLKYQMEDYYTNSAYNVNQSFGFYLRQYLTSLDKKNKDFAKDINIDETELSQLLNAHRKPSEKIIIRLEIHSNKTIPAITWYKILEKEKEYQIITDKVIRKAESKNVKNKLQVSI